MDSLASSLGNALHLLWGGDNELWRIIAISFKVTSLAISIALPPSLLLAFLLAFTEFPGRRLLVTIFNTLLSVPAVVVGLTLYIVLSRQGPLGDFRLLFTQTAMVLGQIALCVPILVAMSHAALQSADKRAWETTRALGAGIFKTAWTLMHETRFALLAAILAAYGRIIAEVGASMMLGGNILNVTRNIPTAIALETSKGDFAQGIALGIVLLMISFSLNAAFHHIQGRGQSHL